MLIYDRIKKEKVEFIPLKNRDVKIYVCGPTVYDDAHLGHARSAISFDLLKRVLEELNYKVTFMKNFTDIDDKIIKKALETGQDFKEVALKYQENYLNDMAKLGVKRADIEPKATESLKFMENMINNLITKDFAYQVKNGDIYFNTKKFNDYGSFSNMVENENLTQARVENSDLKKDIKDFVLWKAKKSDDTIFFNSKFGDGRPGWHIECSAMIDEYLAYKDMDYAIDIHGGGADLIFPHHENEIAQTKCATNKNLAKYWIHNGFVNINGEKMSKSLGNSFFIKDALKNYDGEVLRFYLLSIHYRANLNFSEEDMLIAKKRVDKIYRLKKRLYLSTAGKKPNNIFKKDLLSALSDDLNISKALAIVDKMITDVNELLDKEPKNKAIKKDGLANIEYLNKLLGIGGQNSYKYFQFGISEEQKKDIEDLILQRDLAKKDKKYDLADEIRDKLKMMNLSIMDTANGTVWEKN